MVDRQYFVERLVTFLLLLFAFTAWYRTALSNVALAILSILFLFYLPCNWLRLRRDPAFWLLFGGTFLTTLLAWRATVLFPEFSAQQWQSLSGWLRPLLFIVVAWWLRGDQKLARWMLVAASIGLAFGIIHRAGDEDLEAMMALISGDFGISARADFGFTGLGLAFLTTVALLGYVIFNKEIKAISFSELMIPGFGWLIWTLAVVFFMSVLIATQARGAVLGLAVIFVIMMLYRLANRRNAYAHWTGFKLGLYSLSGLMVLTLASALFWISSDRTTSDFSTLFNPNPQNEYSYESSMGSRLNLYRIGIALIKERPILGWGPGTNATRDLIPARVLEFSVSDFEQGPRLAHLHSVPIEILVRFGLIGGMFAVLVLILLVSSYREMRRSVYDPHLYSFLLFGGLMASFFSLYDFRLIRVDFGFFFILFFGILYSFRFRPSPRGDEVNAEP